MIIKKKKKLTKRTAALMNRGCRNSSGFPPSVNSRIHRHECTVPSVSRLRTRVYICQKLACIELASNWIRLARTDLVSERRNYTPFSPIFIPHIVDTIAPVNRQASISFIPSSVLTIFQ